MKKVVCLIAVFALTAPLFADEPNVYITCDNDGLDVTVSYNTVDSMGDAGIVRAFSFDVTVDNGAKITAITGYAAAGAAPGIVVPAGYSIYMSSIDFGTDPNNVDVWGDPVADDATPDALGGLNTGGITVEMGSLYDMDSGTGPEPNAGDLFTITVDKACHVTIEDTVQKGTRGGIVMEDGTGAKLVSVGCDATSNECMKSTHPDYLVWQSVGSPDCWCYARQCKGDIDGKQEFSLFWVLDNDLAVFKDAYAKTTLPAGGICADLDHLKEFSLFRVLDNDLAIFKGSYADTGVTECDSTHFNFWITP